VDLLQKLSKLFDGQARILDYSAHGIGFYRVVARNCNLAHIVCHDNVLALANDTKPGLSSALTAAK